MGLRVLVSHMYLCLCLCEGKSDRFSLHARAQIAGEGQRKGSCRVAAGQNQWSRWKPGEMNAWEETREAEASHDVK
jgi:hypothetical protein